ncbi:MAG: HAD family hydrolase [Ilumatobacteraceae bacterium]
MSATAMPAPGGNRFDVIGLDADDTLWHSEDSFAVVEARFVELVGPHAPDGVDVAAALRATETAQLPIAGYGVKAFTLSMVRAALTATEDRVPQSVIGQLLDAGMGMLTEQVRLLPHVPEVLADLSGDHQLVLITKGDLVHQMRKVTTSGLAHHFHHVEVVLEKDAETYARILDVIGVPAARFCMVGNSVRSDILPVLALGAHAVHIPYPLLWEHEHVDHDEELDELTSIRDLPAALRDGAHP